MPVLSNGLIISNYVSITILYV